MTEPSPPTRSVRAFVRALRLVDGGYLAAHAFACGLWLGMASKQLIDRVDDAYYTTASDYTDDSYTEKGLWDWERDAVDAFFGSCHRIAVIGAGGGREVLALAEIGHDVTGFECNPHLVRYGNDLLTGRSVAARLVGSERDRWPADDDRTFDAVIVGWGAYMHIQGRDRRVELLRQAASRLPEGAPVLLSFFARARHGEDFRIMAGVGNGLRRIRSRERLDLGDAVDIEAVGPTFVHYFTRDQVEDELRAGGFTPVAFETVDYGRAVGRVTPTASAHLGVVALSRAIG